ncbi:MAG: phosphoglycerate mutase family protein [Acidimicrobiales bacterium]|nr:phosphoglycerate mutase family protein [Acidimicrobiales bacterium]
MLFLVRHGRTEANAAGLLLGRADPSLDDLGRAQATALARALPSVDRVIASPLRRAQETAAAFGLPVETDDRWIELDYGDWDGQPIGDVPVEAWTAWRADTDFCPPGGECLGDLGRRVRAACDDLAESASTSNVVVVTHVSPVKAAVAWALDVGDEATWRMYVAPASISRVDFRDTRPVLVSFDEVGHLPQP